MRILAILAFALFFSLASCGDSKTEKRSESQSDTGSDEGERLPDDLGPPIPAPDERPDSLACDFTGARDVDPERFALHVTYDVEPIIEWRPRSGLGERIAVLSQTVFCRHTLEGGERGQRRRQVPTARKIRVRLDHGESDLPGALGDLDLRVDLDSGAGELRCRSHRSGGRELSLRLSGCR